MTSSTSSASTRPFLCLWREAVRKNRTLKAPTKCLLYTLATYARNDGSCCFPSQKTLAEDTHLHETGVRRHLRLAVSAGLLTWHGRKGSRGPLSNLYEFLLPEQEETGGGTEHQRSVPTEYQRSVPTEHQRSPNRVRQEQSHRTESLTTTGSVVELRRLWVLLLGQASFPSRVVEGASYAEASTALAWTLYGRLVGMRRKRRIRNLTAYFVAMLQAIQRGEVEARTYGEKHFLAVLEHVVSPDQLTGLPRA